MEAKESLDILRERWNHLYRVKLPLLAKDKDPSQPTWPVHLDHCFARIILDNAVGKDRPWAKVLKSPAYKNMNRQQLGDAIALGEKLAIGEEDLVALDEKSLALRGKSSKQARLSATSEKKRKQKGQDVIEDERTEKRPRKSHEAQ